MMGWYGNGAFWGGFGSAGVLMFAFWVFAFVDVVLLAVWLWKQILKK
jgi:hypothetical protein